MAACHVLQTWATDAMADALIQTVQLAQPAVAPYASQQHRGIRRTLATAWQRLCWQLAIIANAVVLLTHWPWALEVVKTLTLITCFVRATVAQRLALFAQDVVIYVAPAAHTAAQTQHSTRRPSPAWVPQSLQ